MTTHTEAWAYLAAARRAGPGPGLPEALRPRTEADAYAIQALGMAALGEIGGWKVGAPGPEAPISCAPMPAFGLHHSPAVLNGSDFTSREIESEIAFVIGQDLPPRTAPYTEAEIDAAIASCHAGLEVLQSRFAQPDDIDGLSNLADLIRHGAYVLGAPIEGWRGIAFPALAVRQVIAGEEIVRVGNPAGDMMRLMVWLANVGAAWAGGLKAGQIVTCGSWTGKLPAPVGAAVSAHFAGAPVVELRFG
jgi:2-keto-4-pentenoate hydratase